MKNDTVKFKTEFKKRMYEWVLRIIKHIDATPRSMSHDVLGKQLLRSSTSVLANYVEANSASSKKDFINFFTHALKSANETKVWLTLLRDTGKNQKEATLLLDECIEISNIVAAGILTLKGKR